MIYGIPDSGLIEYLKDKEYIIATDEGESVGMAVGHYLATKEIPTVFMSADGFCNALNPLTSLVIPYDIPINFIISSGRKEPQHKVMTDTLKNLIKLYENKGRINFTIIE